MHEAAPPSAETVPLAVTNPYETSERPGAVVAADHATVSPGSVVNEPETIDVDAPSLPTTRSE